MNCLSARNLRNEILDYARSRPDHSISRQRRLLTGSAFQQSHSLFLFSRIASLNDYSSLHEESLRGGIVSERVRYLHLGYFL